MPVQQITPWGKFLAGVLLVSATAFAINLLLQYWPNKMPPLGKGDNAWYTNTPYKVTLIEDSASSRKRSASEERAIDSLIYYIDSTNEVIRKKVVAKDSTVAKDSLQLAVLNKALKEHHATWPTGASSLESKAPDNHDDKIHLNTILLILVATMGFLGNMIHIAASFTSYVGNGTFERSWILWYFVKPFTAAALAIIVYFIIRAGFLSYGSDPSSVSLYGLVCLAALTGLFTDNATLKLKEVFDVIFKPKDDRKDKLDDFKITVASITPDKIDVNTANKINIKGENFKKKTLQIKMNGSVINNAVITDTTIDFTYTVGDADKTKTTFEMTIADVANNVIDKKTFTV